MFYCFGLGFKRCSSNTSDQSRESESQMHSMGDVHFRRQQLKEAFDTADKNKDGVISPKEMEDFLKERGVRVSRTTSLKNRLRPKRNMTFEQFCQKIYRSQNTQKKKTSKMEQYKALFKFLDENGDGLITRIEIRERMKLSGQDLTDDQIDQMIRLGDKNNDEQIDFDEFVELMNLLHDNPTSSGESDTDNFVKSCTDKALIISHIDDEEELNV